MRVPLARAEEARARFLDLAPDGFEEAVAGEELELAAYVGEDGEAAVRAAFGRASTARVEPGWEAVWRRFHRPVRVGPLWIGPPWEEPDAGSLPVVIDPGRAFGTGSHPTTRLCLELLLEIERASLLDVGCGSGVVAVAAARLGFAPVSALDADEALDARVDARTFVVSGYLERDRPSLARWRHVERRTLDGWAADRFERA